MTRAQLTFLLELLASREELGFIAALNENHDDEATRNAYVDFLLDRGRDLFAELVRKGMIPGVRDSKSSQVTPGIIASGQIGHFQIASGMVYSGQIAHWRQRSNPEGYTW